jgi:hypothetical protein
MVMSGKGQLEPLDQPDPLCPQPLGPVGPGGPATLAGPGHAFLTLRAGRPLWSLRPFKASRKREADEECDKGDGQSASIFPRSAPRGAAELLVPPETPLNRPGVNQCTGSFPGCCDGRATSAEPAFIGPPRSAIATDRIITTLAAWSGSLMPAVLISTKTVV